MLNWIAQDFTSISATVAYTLITAYATLAVIRLAASIAHKDLPKHGRMVIEGIGGLIYLIGLALWLILGQNGEREELAAIKTLGAAIALFPRVIILSSWGNHGSHT